MMGAFFSFFRFLQPGWRGRGGSWIYIFVLHSCGNSYTLQFIDNFTVLCSLTFARTNYFLSYFECFIWGNEHLCLTLSKDWILFLNKHLNRSWFQSRSGCQAELSLTCKSWRQRYQTKWTCFQGRWMFFRCVYKWYDSSFCCLRQTSKENVKS